jgi:hypothetical protein
MNKVILLVIIAFIFCALVYFYNSLNKKIEIKESFDDPETININPISNTIDTQYLKQKDAIIYNTKTKLNALKEKLYNYKLNDILQLNTVVIKDNDKFSINLKSNNNFNNIFTIEVPTGKQGPMGPTGEKGDIGEKGPRGDRGPEGNCGLLIK